MAIDRIKLPYAMKALEPYISEETLQFHYDKHHKTYVDKLIGMLPGTKFATSNLFDIMMNSEGGIFNNAAQVWNHDFYWLSLTPKSKGEPVGNVSKAIQKKFGTIDDFKKKFAEAAVGNFGSGWTWLVKDKNGDVAIENTSNAHNPLTQKTGSKPLLTCDVWEHAYYIDYRNRRPDYVEAFWKLVNWEFAEDNFNKK